MTTHTLDSVHVVWEISPSNPSMREPLFASRTEAGKQLASTLAGIDSEHLVVVGVARGGAVVAAKVAALLDAPLDIVAIRKVENPLLRGGALGAVSVGGEVRLHVNSEIASRDIAEAVARAEREVAAIEQALRAALEPVDLEEAHVVLVDDGVATGATMTAAVRAVRARGATRIVVAVPVGSVPGLTSVLREEVIETVCLRVMDELEAVSDYYETFQPVGEEALLACLEPRPRAACR